MLKNENRSIWVDYVRIIACFSVVILHSTAPFLLKYNDLPLMHWMVGNVYDSVVRMCVPLFFMISGYLLLEKNESIAVFYKKRLGKIVPVLTNWSFIYIAWAAFYEKNSQIIFRSFYSLAFSPAYYHLWFLYAITGIYLYVPILRTITKNCDINTLYYYLILWFLAVSIIPIGEEITGLNSEVDFLSISGYSGYLVIGLLLGKKTLTKKTAMITAFACLFFVFFTAMMTYALTIHNGRYSGYFCGYLTPNIIILSASVFLLIKYTVETLPFFSNKRVVRVVRSISAATLGIYLVHPIFLSILGNGNSKFFLSVFEGNPLCSIPLISTIVFLLSYLSTILLKRLPIVRIV
jgi:surface polysaccharide O-acyltransferase-like enzyme